MLTSFTIGLSLGLVGGLHCMTMCGPIAAFLHSNSKLKSSSIVYNVGRLTTYMLLGLSIGLLGEGFAVFGYQQVVSILSGILVLSFVLLPQLFKLNTSLGFANRVVVKLRDRMVAVSKTKSLSTYFGLGILNGMLPCGMVYMALVAAFATSNALTSSILMIGFGLGTFPLMLFISLGSQAFSKKIAIKRIVPALSIVVGVVLILRGMALDIPYLSPLLAQIGWDNGITTCQ